MGFVLYFQHAGFLPVYSGHKSILFVVRDFYIDHLSTLPSVDLYYTEVAGFLKESWRDGGINLEMEVESDYKRGGRLLCDLATDITIPNTRQKHTTTSNLPRNTHVYDNECRSRSLRVVMLLCGPLIVVFCGRSVW